ncbi:hypothetical protein EGK63_15185 [Brevundimonas sp. 357]|nr:hypothetical protein EGK63_15185 [Brevundimonas sp. 357]
MEFDGLRGHLAPFYSAIDRPSIDPELLIRMLLEDDCFGIRFRHYDSRDAACASFETEHWSRPAVSQTAESPVAYAVGAL